MKVFDDGGSINSATLKCFLFACGSHDRLSTEKHNI